MLKKAVILAGGLGSRMGLFTRRCGNKHVIPVYNRPMIEYPLSTFSWAGIKELAVVTSNHHAGDLARLIGNGREFGFDNVQYYVQVGEGGIADALKLVRPFVGDDDFAVILGDNLFEMDIRESLVVYDGIEEKEKSLIFLKQVHDPNRFGIAEIDELNRRILSIEEKPKEPKSNYAITGLYFFDSSVFDCAENIIPSARGELEITDVLNCYMQKESLYYMNVKGFWSDMGTPNSLLYSSEWALSNQSGMIESGRFNNYRFKTNGKIGDYII